MIELTDPACKEWLLHMHHQFYDPMRPFTNNAIIQYHL